VHGFVDEVAACILHYDDVEVGDIRDGHFTGWGLKPWEAHVKLEQELLAMDTFLDDKERCVFHRPQRPNQTLQPTAPRLLSVFFVVPSGVEESLIISDHAVIGNIKRCLDFARHDKLTGT